MSLLKMKGFLLLSLHLAWSSSVAANDEVLLPEDENAFWKRFLIESSRGFSVETSKLEPTRSPATFAPTPQPSETPSVTPTPGPSSAPTVSPSQQPSSDPSSTPSALPTSSPSQPPSNEPTSIPSTTPTSSPSQQPSSDPSSTPSALPTSSPSQLPSNEPTSIPSSTPTAAPTQQPSSEPSQLPSLMPSQVPTTLPSVNPTYQPSVFPSVIPSSGPTNERCFVQAEVSCTTMQGQACETLDYPRCGIEMDSVIFRYEPEACQQEMAEYATCEDAGSISTFLPVVVRCTSGASETLQVEPVFVVPGESLSVKSNDIDNGLLHDTVQCNISGTGGGSAIQTVTLQVQDVRLQDKIGSFFVETCGNLTCAEEVVYQYKLYNLGSADMNITVAERTFNGNTTSFLEDLPLQFLRPGQSTELRETETIDLCTPGSPMAQIRVEADPPAGQSCQAAESHGLVIVPDCVVDLDMTCIVDQDGSDCTDLKGVSKPQCICDPCVDTMVFRYTGANCAASVKGQLFCKDSIGGPAILGEAEILVSTDTTVLFQNTVKPGDAVVLDVFGHCIGERLFVIVTDTLMGAIHQQVVINSACELGSSISLVDSFGSLQFNGYSCLGVETHLCNADVTYGVHIQNRGQVDFTISNFVFFLNHTPVNLLNRDSAPSPALSSGAILGVAVKTKLDRCHDNTYKASAMVSGITSGSSVICEDEDGLDISLNVGTLYPTQLPTHKPSMLPSTRPSSEPTGAPSMAPSSLPSEIPSHAPSASPSTSPTSTPSSTPTSAPSQQPTSEPSLLPSPTPSQLPTELPSKLPTSRPSTWLSTSPTNQPSNLPSVTHGLVVTDCDMGLDLTCSVDQDGSDCSQLEGIGIRQCICDCTDAMAFRYTGTNCSGSLEGQLFCMDRQGGPTVLHEANIVVSTEDTVLFQGRVRPGDTVSLDGLGSCIGQRLFVLVTDQLMGSVYQHVVINSACELGASILLKDSFGSLEFNGYSCQSDKNFLCLEDVTYGIHIKNQGLVDIAITDFDFFVGGMPLASFKDNPLIMSGASLETAVKTVVDRCHDTTHKASAVVKGIGSGSSVICKDEDALDISIMVRTTPMPTYGPSSSPSATPSRKPTAVPSAIPSMVPSLSPSDIPSFEPSTVPSDAPTNSGCLVEAEVLCTTASGVNCDALEALTSSCSIGESIEIITFQYTTASCRDSQNA